MEGTHTRSIVTGCFSRRRRFQIVETEGMNQLVHSLVWIDSTNQFTFVLQVVNYEVVHYPHHHHLEHHHLDHHLVDHHLDHHHLEHLDVHSAPHAHIEHQAGWGVPHDIAYSAHLDHHLDHHL